MTIGISKARLLELQIEGAHSECTFNFEQAIQLAIDECTELEPWLPINDHTPRDRIIRLLYPKSGENYDRLVLECKYTEYFELHSDRKPRYWQEVTPDPV